MELRGKLRPGMRILGADGRDYGTVERFEDDAVYVDGRRVPASAFEHVDDDRLYIGEAGRRYFAEAGAEEDGEFRVPVAEERLHVSTRPVELGEVRVHKRVEEVEEVVREPVIRADVEIERVRTRRRVEGPVGPRQEGEWLVVPIVEEMLLVQKVLMVTEEVRIRKRPVTEVQEIRETLRRERVEVEDTTGGTAGPRAANLPEAEPELPRRDEARGLRGGADWEQLREEIREEANRPRAASERPEE